MVRLSSDFYLIVGLSSQLTSHMSLDISPTHTPCSCSNGDRRICRILRGKLSRGDHLEYTTSQGIQKHTTTSICDYNPYSVLKTGHDQTIPLQKIPCLPGLFIKQNALVINHIKVSHSFVPNDLSLQYVRQAVASIRYLSASIFYYHTLPLLTSTFISKFMTLNWL